MPIKEGLNCRDDSVGEPMAFAFTHSRATPGTET